MRKKPKKTKKPKFLTKKQKLSKKIDSMKKHLKKCKVDLQCAHRLKQLEVQFKSA